MTSFSHPLRRVRFTLIELLVSITIIVILAGVLMASSRAILNASRKAKTKAQMQSLMAAFEQYQQDWGYYLQQPRIGPLTKTMIMGKDVGTDHYAGLEKSSNKSTYIDLTASGLSLNADDRLVDAFGNPYYYQSPGTFNEGTFDLWSFGPNKVDESSDGDTDVKDDLCSWRRLE